MSRCHPYPPPGYEKKVQQVPDLALPTTKKKDLFHAVPPYHTLIPLCVKTMMYILLHLWGKGTQKERHKHKDKKKKKKKDKAGDLNGEAHDSQWSSKLQRTDLVNNSLHKEKQNGRVQSESHPSAAFEQPFGKGETWDEGKALLVLSERTSTISPLPLYNIKEGPNGNAVSKPLLVFPLKKNSSFPCRPSRESNMQSLSSDSKDVVSQRQQKIANLATTSACEMLPLSQTSSWAETTDEDWLFVQRPLKTHSKPKAEVDRDAEEPIVWAKAIYLPVVDIYALPYVVPY